MINHPTAPFRIRTAAALLVLGSSLGLVACGGSGGSDSAASYCDRAKALGSIEDRLNTSDAADPKAAVKVFTELSTELNDVAKSAPSEIKDDWDNIASAFTEISTAMKPIAELDMSDPSKIDPKQLESLNAIGDKMKGIEATLKDSGDAISTYTKDKCGFDLGS